MIAEHVGVSCNSDINALAPRRNSARLQLARFDGDAR